MNKKFCSRVLSIVLSLAMVLAAALTVAPIKANAGGPTTFTIKALSGGNSFDLYFGSTVVQSGVCCMAFEAGESIEAKGFAGFSGHAGRADVNTVGAGVYKIKLLRTATISVSGGELIFGEPMECEEDDDCNHNWQWETIYDASEQQDGLEAYVCTKCGARKEEKGISALGKIIDNRYAQIKNAKPGTTTILEMGRNCNLTKEFMTKLAEKNNCDFIIRFTQDNVHYEAYVPAGTKIDTSFEWYGPNKIKDMFAYKVLN